MYKLLNRKGDLAAGGIFKIVLVIALLAGGIAIFGSVFMGWDIVGGISDFVGSMGSGGSSGAARSSGGSADSGDSGLGGMGTILPIAIIGVVVYLIYNNRKNKKEKAENTVTGKLVDYKGTAISNKKVKKVKFMSPRAGTVQADVRGNGTFDITLKENVEYRIEVPGYTYVTRTDAAADTSTERWTAPSDAITSSATQHVTIMILEKGKAPTGSITGDEWAADEEGPVTPPVPSAPGGGSPTGTGP